MRKIISVCLGLMWSSVLYASPICDLTTAEIIAKAYVLGSPIEGLNDVVTFVRSKYEYFVKDGKAIKCMALLGDHLITAGLNAYNPNAYESVMGKGPTDLQPQVAQSINSDAASLHALGIELKWFARVLPYLTMGNYTPYLTTGTPTRNQIKEILPIINLTNNSDPYMRATYEEMLAIYSELAGKQIVMLALMTGE